MDKIIRLCKERGFIFPGSDIYGGLANSWDYGPLGAQMLRNIKADWWKKMVEERQDIVGIDGGIILNPRVWEASGHVETFNDPLVEDKVTHKRYRADHLIEEMTGIDADGKSLDDLAKIIEEHKIKSPEGNDLTAPRQFSGMFETSAGAAGEEKTLYLRPETAQAIFVNFKNVLETTRKRLPFGIAQIGKAFRNEITPGNFIFRTLEFEQMEMEYFVEEDDWERAFEYWENWRLNWAESIGLDKDRISIDEHAPEKLSHYSKKTTDVMFRFPFGVKELWGLAYRTNFDLSQHQKESGQKLEYTDPNDQSRKFIPHVVEPAFGVTRTLLALLVSAYDEEQLEGEDSRIVMRFKPHMAPYQVAVLPLSKKEELQGKSQEVLNAISSEFRTDYDETQSIGKRYRRQDEIGTPYCVTVDFDSLEDNAVTVRDRDTMEQERVAISELGNYLSEKMK